MQLTVPQNTSFLCPEGAFHATFYQAKETQKQTPQGPEKQVRLLFQIDALTNPETLMLAGKSFAPSLARGSQLRNFLDMWLGEKFVDQHKKAGKFDFDSLNNLKADVRIVHFQNQNHPHPYSNLVAAYPFETLPTTCDRDEVVDKD